MLVDSQKTTTDESPNVQPGFRRTDEPTPKEISLRIKELEKKMHLAADALNFEEAAEYRDEISDLRQRLSIGRHPTDIRRSPSRHG